MKVLFYKVHSISICKILSCNLQQPQTSPNEILILCYFALIVAKIYANSLVRNLKMYVTYLEEKTLHVNFNLYGMSMSEDKLFSLNGYKSPIVNKYENLILLRSEYLKMVTVLYCLCNVTYFPVVFTFSDSRLLELYHHQLFQNRRRKE